MKLVALKTLHLGTTEKNADGKVGKRVVGIHQRGDEFEVAAEIAKRLIERGLAGKRGEVELDVLSTQATVEPKRDEAPKSVTTESKSDGKPKK